ncbi:MAG: tRNA (adenosine(37)-N6)-dimethylallyltransferase MiaA [Elusimicrobiota bacterium]|jgi:tRNA dimethylallyltransferase|nr:tRNA (adenosine(37)-N6)-dimethylallyltransferase MiaA [Elusimicrobiota bacterium]
MKDNTPIIIAGPTASGKTAIALALAKMLNADIISADSRQVYQLLPIGTAAPKGVWQGGNYKVEGINYHLVDFLPIDKTFDVSQFAAAAEALEAKGGQYIFAGGTGMYLQGYFCGMDNLPKADAALRQELKSIAEQKGKEYLHAMLAKIDPKSAEEIPAGNIQRVMRALEIYRLSGKPASVLRSGKFKAEIPQSKAKMVYLNWDKELLSKRIEERTNLIFDGMASEAKAALELGCSEDAPGLKSLGYKEALEYLKGNLNKPLAINQISTLTRQYAKRQRTWFKRYPNMFILDFNAADFNAEEAAKRIIKWKEQF